MLLIIPLKATKRIELVEPLTKWVETSHPHYKGSQLSLEIKRLNSIRADLSKALASSSSHSFSIDNNSLQDLMEYHACLIECINHGFPSDARDADVNGTMDANLQFWWKNAFEFYDGHEDGLCSPRGLTHFSYERSCVLWNIAALYTYQAAKGDWNSKEGRMAVRNSYHLAAKILRHVKDLNKGIAEADLMPDMYEETLDMCHYLCLAQGQMIAYEALKLKLAEANASSSTYTLLAKIAAGVANHADNALQASQELSIKNQKSSKVWGGHCKVLSMLFHARAEFLQSQVERKDNCYGNEIGRLSRAVNMAREGVEFTKSEGFVKNVGDNGPPSLGNCKTSLQSLLLNAKQRRKVIVDENDHIYHEQVPDSMSMKKIQGKDMMEYDEKDVELPPEFMPVGLARPMFVSFQS